MSGLPKENINFLNTFRAGLPFEGEFDVDWFVKIPSKAAAEERLEFIRNQRNVTELINRGYGGEALNRMYRAVYRACIGYDVPLTSSMKHHASTLGVIVS